MTIMNPYIEITKLIEILAKAERDLVYLGSEPQHSELGEPIASIEVAEELGPGSLRYIVEEARDPPYQGYLDSSSRSIAYPGLRVFIGACYAKDIDRHIMVPSSIATPYLAIQMSRKAISTLRSYLAGLAYVENPSGSPYDEKYKPDNIHDELRLRLENRVLGIMRSDKILIDGPIYPVQIVFAEKFGKEYYESFEKLYSERKPYIERLIGIVKRLDQTFKLSRIAEIRERFVKTVGREINAPDPIIMSRLAGERSIYITEVLREEFELIGSRYMIYIYVRTPSGPRTFRLESLDKETLIRAAGYLLKTMSASGLPLDIEIADRISKKLSASIYMALYILGAPRLGLVHDESVKVSQVLGELKR